MTTPADLTLPEGAPEEVITHAILRPVDLTPFGFKGTLALITKVVISKEKTNENIITLIIKFLNCLFIYA